MTIPRRSLRAAIESIRPSGVCVMSISCRGARLPVEIDLASLTQAAKIFWYTARTGSSVSTLGSRRIKPRRANIKTPWFFTPSLFQEISSNGLSAISTRGRSRVAIIRSRICA